MIRSLKNELKHRAKYRLLSFTPFVKETRPGLPRVIVNSFPKSGTHLLAKLIADIGFIELPIFLHQRGFSDFTRPGPWSNWKPVVENKIGKIDNPKYIDCPIHDVLARMRPGQVAPAHLGRDASLVKFFHNKKIKHLLIVRDLRDCVYSYVQHYTSLKSNFPRADWYYYLTSLNDIEEQLIAIIEGRDLFLESYRSIIEHIEKWIGHPEVLVLCYEHLIGAKGGGSEELQFQEVARILSFLGLPSEPARVEEVAGTLWGGGSRTFRAGKMDYWKEAFTPRVQEVFDRELGDIQAKVRSYIDRKPVNGG